MAKFVFSLIFGKKTPVSGSLHSASLQESSPIARLSQCTDESTDEVLNSLNRWGRALEQRMACMLCWCKTGESEASGPSATARTRLLSPLEQRHDKIVHSRKLILALKGKSPG